MPDVILPWIVISLGLVDGMGWVWGWEAEGEADWCGLFLGVMGWVGMGCDGDGEWRLLRIDNLHETSYSKPCGYKRGDMHTPTTYVSASSRLAGPGSPRLADRDGAASQPVLLFPHPHLHGTSRYGPRDSDSDNAL